MLLELSEKMNSDSVMRIIFWDDNETDVFQWCNVISIGIVGVITHKRMKHCLQIIPMERLSCILHHKTVVLSSRQLLQTRRPLICSCLASRGSSQSVSLNATVNKYEHEAHFLSKQFETARIIVGTHRLQYIVFFHCLLMLWKFKNFH